MEMIVDQPKHPWSGLVMVIFLMVLLATISALAWVFGL